MSTAFPSAAAAGGHRAITVAALMATYVETVNISIPNAALPHIQGALSMADDQVGWVFTAYLAAGAAVMPMARWLAGRYGRKTIYQLSLAVFSLGLMLDTFATTPMQFVFARIVQGVASGPLAPLSLAILLDVLPPARHAVMSHRAERIGQRGPVGTNLVLGFQDFVKEPFAWFVPPRLSQLCGWSWRSA